MAQHCQTHISDSHTHMDGLVAGSSMTNICNAQVSRGLLPWNKFLPWHLHTWCSNRQSRLQENEQKMRQKTNTSAEWWDEPKDKPRQLRSQAVSQYLEDTWDCVGLLASQLFTTDGFLQQWNETRHESCACHGDSVSIPPGTPHAAHLESNEDTGFSTELLLSHGFFPESEKQTWKGSLLLLL